MENQNTCTPPEKIESTHRFMEIALDLIAKLRADKAFSAGKEHIISNAHGDEHKIFDIGVSVGIAIGMATDDSKKPPNESTRAAE